MVRRPVTPARIERKIERLEARIARNPQSARLFQGLGKSLVALGCTVQNKRSEAALLAFRRSLELDPNDPWTHLFLANLFYFVPQYARALEAAKRAHELAPRVGMALVMMADTYAAMRKYADADLCFHKAVEVDPTCAVCRKNLARWLKFWEPEKARRQMAAEAGAQPRHRTRDEHAGR